MTTTPQPGILLPVPKQARYLSFSIVNAARIADSLRELGKLTDGE